MTTTLTVADRIATISTDEKIVAGNTYTVTLSLDAEWTGTYYLRIRFGSLYYDIPVSSSSVDVQIPVGYPEVGIGLYSDALSICTNEARIKVLRSILEQGVSVVEFDTDLYNQWAGEVSELVCDDEFDASSNKPLKNSVITTWKNNLPEYVTLTGNQSISGVKSFSVIDAGTITASGGADQFTIAKNSNNTVTMDVQNNGMMFTGKLGGHDFPSALGFRVEDGTVCLVSNNYTGSSGLVVVNKQMLADDASLVRVTGNQTIGGTKTFSDGVVFSRSSSVNATPIVLDNGDSVIRRNISIGTANNALHFNNDMGKCDTSIVVKGYNTNDMAGLGVKNVNPDDATDTANNFYCYSQSYYPMDGTTHLAPSEHIIMNSGMIAVDPRIVHTTGSEIIAGSKVFTEDLYVRRSTTYANLYLRSTGIYNRLFSQRFNAENTAYDDTWEIGPRWGSPTANVINIRSFAPRTTLGDTNETQAYLNLAMRAENTGSGLLAVSYSNTSGSSTNIDLLRFNSGGVSLYAPTYTEDNSADQRVVNRAMLAQSPAVVHTTGNETVAGTKQFTNGINAYPVGWNPMFKSSMGTGDYCIFAKISTLTNAGRNIVFDIKTAGNTVPAMGRIILKAYSSPMCYWVFKTPSGGANDPLTYTSIVVLKDDSNLYLAWKKEYAYGSVMCRIASDSSYTNERSISESIVEFYSTDNMVVTSDLSSYTVYEVAH